MAAASVSSGPTTISLPLSTYEEPEPTTWELVQRLASQILEKLREGCRAVIDWVSGTSVAKSLGQYMVFRILSGFFGGVVDQVERAWKYGHCWWLGNDNAALQAQVAVLQRENQLLRTELARSGGRVCALGSIYLARDLSGVRYDASVDAQCAAIARQRDIAEEELARLRGAVVRPSVEEVPIQISTTEEGVLALFGEFARGSELIENRAKGENIGEDLLRAIETNGIVRRQLVQWIEDVRTARNNGPLSEIQGVADVSPTT